MNVNIAQLMKLIAPVLSLAKHVSTAKYAVMEQNNEVIIVFKFDKKEYEAILKDLGAIKEGLQNENS